jgi:hypothetical protein
MAVSDSLLGKYRAAVRRLIRLILATTSNVKPTLKKMSKCIPTTSQNLAMNLKKGVESMGMALSVKSTTKPSTRMKLARPRLNQPPHYRMARSSATNSSTVSSATTNASPRNWQKTEFSKNDSAEPLLASNRFPLNCSSATRYFARDHRGEGASFLWTHVPLLMRRVRTTFSHRTRKEPTIPLLLAFATLGYHWPTDCPFVATTLNDHYEINCPLIKSQCRRTLKCFWKICPGSDRESTPFARYYRRSPDRAKLFVGRNSLNHVGNMLGHLVVGCRKFFQHLNEGHSYKR